MKFLLFNIAVIAALLFLFSGGRSSTDVAVDHRNDALDAISQELDSLVREAGDELKAPQSAVEGARQDASEAPPEEVADPAPREPQNRPVPAASDRTEIASAEEGTTSTETQPQPVLDGDPRAGDSADASGTPPKPFGPEEGNSSAETLAALPQVDDPAVARRRAEVLDGVLPVEDQRTETPVKPGPAMSPEERLRRLYSLAEEMELLYVSKMTR